jgi:hypothetical protein
MVTLGSNNAPAADSEYFVVLSPEHAQQAAAEGWSREDVQLYLYQQARIRLGLRREHFGSSSHGTPWMHALEDAQALVPMTSRPELIRTMVAGGVGKHCCVIPSWGPASRSVTVPVEDWK